MRNSFKSLLTANFFKTLVDSFNFVISPPICVLCSKLITSGIEYSQHICRDCIQSLPKPKSSREILERIDNNFGKEQNPYSFAYSLYDSEGSHKHLELIHKFKYSRFKQIGYFLGTKLGEILASEIPKLGFQIHYVLPIPIHKVRCRERGFNQAVIIANAIHLVTKIPTKQDFIVRNVYTESQTQLNLNERIKNVESAFKLNVDVEQISGKNFLIIDDVITTGSTLFYCGKLLKENGADKLILAVLTTA